MAAASIRRLFFLEEAMYVITAINEATVEKVVPLLPQILSGHQPLPADLKGLVTWQQCLPMDAVNALLRQARS